MIDRMLDTFVTPRGDDATDQALRIAVLTVSSAQMIWSLFAPLFHVGLGVDPIELESIAAPLLRMMLKDPIPAR